MKSRSAKERFLAKVEKTETCWLWRGGLKGGGYGIFYLDGKYCGAHRVSLLLFKSLPFQPGLDAMHSCDNPACVNPDHLSYGTRTQNMQDAAAKGRTRCMADWRGQKNPKSKLSSEQIAEIQARRSAGEQCKKIASDYGISDVRVSQLTKAVTAKSKKAGGGWAIEEF